MKRNSKQRIEDELDKLWSKIIKIRAGYKCQITGKAATDAHHIARKSATVRWELSNGIALARKEHDHDHEAEMNAKIIKVIGQAKFNELEAKARETKRWREPDLVELRDSLKEIYNYYKTECTGATR